MRTVINILSPRLRRRVRVLGFLAATTSCLLLSSLSPSARADSAATNPRAVLASFFPKSQRVTFKNVVLTAALKERLAHRLGYVPASDRYVIFVATTGSSVDGYAVIDDEKGEHQPITFATKLSPQAVVEGVEIVAYREPRGDEVRDARFRAQFVGKTARDSLRLSHEIDAVSGATISSGAMAVAVRRAAVLVDELMVARTALATAGTESPSSRPQQLAR